MKRLLLLVVLLVGMSWSVLGQSRERLSGWCEQGNWQVTTDGRTSTTRVQRSYSSCTVTVYDAGTTDLASIASDYGGTPKANPFTASVTGFWDFFGVEGRYDVRLSGSGITSPFTIPGLWIRTGGGGGGGAPVDATYVTLSLNPTLTNERVLTAGDNIELTDTGANGTITVTAAPTDPGNPDTSIQSNQGGTFYGDLGLLYNFTTDVVSIGQSSSTNGMISFKNSANGSLTGLRAGTTPTGSFNVLLPQSLPAGADECLQISSTGQISGIGAACGSGGGPGSGTVPYAAYWSSTTVLGSSSGVQFTPTQATITSAKIITDFRDTNDNSWIKVGVTASAVNELTITNAAMSGSPSIDPTGTDTNINLLIGAKGTGEIRFTQAAYSVPVVLADASTITTNAYETNRFEVTLTASRTLGNPVGAQNGQQIVWTVIQDGTGGWSLAFDTKFAFGAEITACTINTTANALNFITTIYRSSQDKFYIVGCVTGYN